jgi:hypothetical protein
LWRNRRATDEAERQACPQPLRSMRQSEYGISSRISPRYPARSSACFPVNRGLTTYHRLKHSAGPYRGPAAGCAGSLNHSGDRPLRHKELHVLAPNQDYLLAILSAVIAALMVCLS